MAALMLSIADNWRPEHLFDVLVVNKQTINFLTFVL